MVALGWCEDKQEVWVPPPDKQLSMDEARQLYNSFILFLDRYPKGPSLPLPTVWIKVLERLLSDFPDERFLHTKGLGLPERVERAKVRFWLATSYLAEGKVYEGVVLRVQDLLLDWAEYEMKKSGFLYGFPMSPFPDPFRGDPPRAVVDLAKYVEELLKKSPPTPPLIFVRGWCVRARWEGEDSHDALVSLNELAYALNQENWRKIIERDWKAWRFTVKLKDKTLTFTADSLKASVSGEEIQLRRKVERFHYDLYVPLGDLVKAVGGKVRPPEADELTVFQKHFPVPILVVDLN